MDDTARHRADRDEHLAAHIQSATQSLREERDRLAKRLADLERELENLAARLESPSAYVMSGASGQPRS
jgi:predicted  nucleic acid-binding Zn-ribbon protein